MAEGGDPCMADESEDELDELYIDMFGNHKRKDSRIGNSFQVSIIPSVTDILYFDYLKELDESSESVCNVLWQPERLPPESVGKQ